MSGIFARDIFSDEALGQAVDPSFPPGCGSPGGICDWPAYCAANPASTAAACVALRPKHYGAASIPLSPAVFSGGAIRSAAIQSIPGAAALQLPGALPPPSFQPQTFDVPPGTGPGAPPPPPSNFNLFSNPIFFWGAIGGGVLLVGATGYFLMKKKTTPNRRRYR